MLPLRELTIFGMLVDPAAVLLVVCAIVFFLLRWVVNQLVDLNRYVWRRPLVDIAVFVILYCLTILTLHPL